MSQSSIDNCFKTGKIFEKIVADMILKRGKATVEWSNLKQNKYDHIDFFIIPNDSSKPKISVDVKGLKRSHRENRYYQDNFACLEFQNEWGYPGWLYAHIDYVVFCRFDKIIFSPLKNLKFLAEQLKDKNWKDFYRPKKHLEGFHPYLEQPYGKARKFKKDQENHLDAGPSEDILINVPYNKIEHIKNTIIFPISKDIYKKYGINF